MSLHEPVWRIPSRPCPFYQRGNCVFAARCNFLHVTPEKGKIQRHGSISSRLSSDTIDSPRAKTPILRVESPSSVRSPPIQRLISALTDIIGDEPEDEESEEVYNESATFVEPESAAQWSAGLPTLVHDRDTTFFARVTDTMAEMMRITDGGDPEDSEEEDLKHPPGISQVLHAAPDDNALRPPPIFPLVNDSLDTPSIHTTHSSPEAQYIEMPQIPDNHNDLLSPVDLSHLHLHNFSLDGIADTFKDTSSVDSGFADSFMGPKSPSRSTFDLLHSPFGSPSSRVLSPRISFGRSPSSPVGPLPTEVDQPTLESDLDSPSDRISASVVPEDYVAATTAHQDLDSLPPSPEAGDVSEDTIYAVDDLSTEMSFDGEESDSEEEDRIPEDSYGHTSVWEPVDVETAVFLGSNRNPLADEVQEELDRQSVQLLDQQQLVDQTPQWNDVDIQAPNETITSEELSSEIHAALTPRLEDLEEIYGMGDSPTETDRALSPLLEEESFEEQITSSSAPFASPIDDNDVAEDQFDADITTKSEDDSTAYLGYLQNDTSDTQDGDTIDSLYDVYGSDTPPSPKSSSSFADSPLSAGPLRERVFTPPPPASRSGYGYAHSTPPSSPVPSLRSASKGRASPASIASSSKRSVKNPSEDEQSKKVPFGFRSSRVKGHSVRPSLVLNHGRSLSRLNTNPLSAGLDEPVDRPTSTTPSSASSGGPLRPLRLSVLINSRSNSRLSHSSSSLSLSNPIVYPESAHASLSSVPSRKSFSVSRSLSSAPATSNPFHSSTNLLDSRPERSPSLLTDDLNHLTTFGSPLSAPVAAPPTWAPFQVSQPSGTRPSSRLSDPIYEQEGEEDATYRQDDRDEFIRRPVQPTPRTAPIPTRPESILREQTRSIATPKATLMFAIASDDVEQVRRVLENGDANPNDAVGPQSALQFALTNDQLTNKLDIVKTLLAFGADPSQLTASGNTNHGQQQQQQPSLSSSPREDGGKSTETEPHQMSKTLMDEMDPATRYYVERADAAHTRKTSALIHRSFFRPLTRVRYDLVGQDRALEELFKLLSIHSRQISMSPVVVMFSGPSGHGKSLLARKFGSLLDVPTHTVNMVTVRSQDSLWESYSMNPHEEPTNCTLAEFLVNNEGKRCVVVLDEIEKVDNEKVLWSLLMPWEYGRCSFEAKSRHVDVRNVIWLCTSNIGHDLVFDHAAARENPREMMTRPEYLELVALLRPRVSERLGASVLSRITSVLPFVPFTLDEMRAVCAEAIYQLGGEEATALSMETIDIMIKGALENYIPEEGARSLHRAVSNQLVEMI